MLTWQYLMLRHPADAIATSAVMWMPACIGVPIAKELAHRRHAEYDHRRGSCDHHAQDRRLLGRRGIGRRSAAQVVGRISGLVNANSPRCCECSRVMTGWNEAEARAEYFKMWPNASDADFERSDKVCIDCYDKLFAGICQ